MVSLKRGRSTCLEPMCTSPNIPMVKWSAGLSYGILFITNCIFFKPPSFLGNPMCFQVRLRVYLGWFPPVSVFIVMMHFTFITITSFSVGSASVDSCQEKGFVRLLLWLDGVSVVA